jgi:hypothetical protein
MAKAFVRCSAFKIALTCGTGPRGIVYAFKTAYAQSQFGMDQDQVAFDREVVHKMRPPALDFHQIVKRFSSSALLEKCS